MSSESQKPTPQGSYFIELMKGHNCTANFLERVIDASEIKRNNIKIAVDIGSGRGVGTDALLQCFPRAIVHAIDYYDILHKPLLDNPRVKFHKGLFTDILSQNIIPSADFVFLSFASRHHGFNENNFQQLINLVGKGVLFTIGDNALLESEKWFRNSFQIVHEVGIDVTFDGVLWKCK